MAHLAKYKRQAVAAMVGHYAREAEGRGYGRANIDPSRTRDNYAIGAGSVDELAEMVRERVAEGIELHGANSRRGLRKDANVLCDWVVTLPRDCRAEDADAFFRAAVEFVRNRYGAENVPGGFVHADESSAHVHVPVVPVRDGRLVASKVFDRTDLRGWHEALSAHVERALGYRVSVLLSDEQQAEKQLSALSQGEYQAARDEIERLRDKREELRRQVAQESDRLERLRCARRDAGRQVDELEAVHTAACKCEDARGGGGRDAWAELARRAERAREIVASLGARWRGRASELAGELMRARKYPRRMLSRAERREATAQIRRRDVHSAIANRWRDKPRKRSRGIGLER